MTAATALSPPAPLPTRYAPFTRLDPNREADPDIDIDPIDIDTDEPDPEPEPHPGSRFSVAHPVSTLRGGPGPPRPAAGRGRGFGVGRRRGRGEGEEGRGGEGEEGEDAHRLVGETRRRWIRGGYGLSVGGRGCF